MGSGRSADWADWVADVVGAAVGALMMRYMMIRWPELIKKSADE